MRCCKCLYLMRIFNVIFSGPVSVFTDGLYHFDEKSMTGIIIGVCIALACIIICVFILITKGKSRYVIVK